MYGLILRKSGTSLDLNNWISSTWSSFSLNCRLHRGCLFILLLLSCRFRLEVQQKHKVHDCAKSKEEVGAASAAATAAAAAAVLVVVVVVASPATSTSNMTRRLLRSSSSSSTQEGNDAMLLAFFFFFLSSFFVVVLTSFVGRRQRPKYNRHGFFFLSFLLSLILLSYCWILFFFLAFNWKILINQLQSHLLDEHLS